MLGVAEHADTEALFQHFKDAEAMSQHLLSQNPPLSLPAYDQTMKASHLFNLLYARGVISLPLRYSRRTFCFARGRIAHASTNSMMDGIKLDSC